MSMKILKLFPSHEFKAQMLLHNVPHLRLMFEGDVRFLEQFPC